MPKFTTLTADVMFVNGVPFCVILSEKIELFTVKFLPSRTAAQPSIHVTKAFKIYAIGGLSIRTILMDKEFDKVVENMPTICSQCP